MTSLDNNYGGRALSIAIGTLLVLLLADCLGAATPISACTEISSPGTYVLTQNIVNTTNLNCIIIASDNVVFDGAGYTIDGWDTRSTYGTVGIYVYNSTKALTNVTVKNLKVIYWTTGIIYVNVQNGSITNNTASSNYDGIDLQSSRYNNLTGNVASSNKDGIYIADSSNNTLNNNNASLNSQDGIFLYLSSNNNTLVGNTANLNTNTGFILSWVDNNTLVGNTASLNNNNGVYIFYSNNNTLIGNNVRSNNNEGIYFSYPSKDNTIYNNFFNNNINFGACIPCGNKWNISKTSGTNIIGGSYQGGNVWANPSGTGFSQTCADSNSDGICDSTYTLDSSNIDYLPLVYKPAITPTPTPSLLFAITPNSRNAQLGTPVTIFMSVINYGTATATGVSIKQASSLPATVSYQQWDGTAFTGSANTPVDMPADSTANFVITIDAISAFDSSSMTFNVSGTNVAAAPKNAVNTLTISASSTPSADVIMMSTSLDVSTAVNIPTAFAIATANVGGASATGVSLILDIPDTITGLMYQLNETYPANGTIKGPATGLTIGIGAQPTFAVFITPTQPIAYDPANNRITLQLVNGSARVIGAQSVAVSTT